MDELRALTTMEQASQESNITFSLMTHSCRNTSLPEITDREVTVKDEGIQCLLAVDDVILNMLLGGLLWNPDVELMAMGSCPCCRLKKFPRVTAVHALISWEVQKQHLNPFMEISEHHTSTDFYCVIIYNNSISSNNLYCSNTISPTWINTVLKWTEYDSTPFSLIQLIRIYEYTYLVLLTSLAPIKWEASTDYEEKLDR